MVNSIGLPWDFGGAPLVLVMTWKYAAKDGAEEKVGGCEKPQCVMTSLWLLTSPGMIMGLVVEGNPRLFCFHTLSYQDPDAFVFVSFKCLSFYREIEQILKSKFLNYGNSWRLLWKKISPKVIGRWQISHFKYPPCTPPPSPHLLDGALLEKEESESECWATSTNYFIYETIFFLMDAFFLDLAYSPENNGIN